MAYHIDIRVFEHVYERLCMLLFCCRGECLDMKRHIHPFENVVIDVLNIFGNIERSVCIEYIRFDTLEYTHAFKKVGYYFKVLEMPCIGRVLHFNAVVGHTEVFYAVLGRPLRVFRYRAVRVSRCDGMRVHIRDKSYAFHCVTYVSDIVFGHGVRAFHTESEVVEKILSRVVAHFFWRLFIAATSRITARLRPGFTGMVRYGTLTPRMDI